MALNKVALILDALDSRGAIHLTRNNSIQLFAAVYGNVRSSCTSLASPAYPSRGKQLILSI